MRTDLPEFKRCCCCVPLRFGLLAFGYIRVIFCIPLIILLFVMINWTLMMYSKYEAMSVWDVVVPILVIIVVLIDVALTIMFLVGGHQKSVKLLRVFYIYNIVMLCIGSAFLIFMCAMQSAMYVRFGYQEKHGFVFASSGVTAEVITSLSNIGYDIYFILLLRSEINKLKNSYNFRFTNVAAEQIENGHTPQENVDLQITQN